ncbi:R.Ecl18kI (restriction endonuclease) [Bifidobacterium saguini DSM 23967]|uniref:R.Ecl18kI (Restriction endonuclease) n=2 Tax=Bifidobacterium saguini TaxID=762210 RepID=A0A087DCS9_9BIFI|nr:type II restriction endonuclease [Bifidobacterium saguini]KFI93329.1 R.Ecl18kI (restriction endonuclease) [Bifidobacterium saguini DSM 23967]QTB90542.1 restriction endonuclease [Bifidobacterium saguini]
MDIEEYKEKARKLRTQKMPKPFDLAYDAFVDLGFDTKQPDFFKNNASEFVESMRTKCWEKYLEGERKFTTEALGLLAENDDSYDKLSGVEAVTQYVTLNAEPIYQLSLSNTQSRRSRAGKEFEAIIELMFIGAGIPVDSQGSIGKDKFMHRGLSKLVDFVSPSVVQYNLNKLNTVLVSAKTTLRERWQEVPEERSRTGAHSMYLATLDTDITKETLDTCYEANVIIATTRNIKQEKYMSGNNANRVVTFEDLLQLAYDSFHKWDNYVFRQEDIDGISKYLTKQIAAHQSHPYVRNYYQSRLTEITIPD